MPLELLIFFYLLFLSTFMLQVVEGNLRLASGEMFKSWVVGLNCAYIEFCFGYVSS